MQPESHPFEKEKYLPILPNKKTQGMVDSKRTSCPGCMRFHMVSKPSGASQKHTKKKKKTKTPNDTTPLCGEKNHQNHVFHAATPKLNGLFGTASATVLQKTPKNFHTHMLRKRGTISRTIRTWQSGPTFFHSHSFTAIVLIHSVHKQRPSGCSQSGSFKMR